MKYLVIENEGVADVRSFTLLGVSTARGEETKIGQFGSGAKHAILIALRAKLDIHIVTPYARIEPFLRDQFIENKLHQQVCFRIIDANGEREEPSSMTLGFGELDWQADMRAMVREFVSNALDAVGASELDAWDKINVFTSSSVDAGANKTRVFIEFSEDLRKEYAQVESLFLHATKQHLKHVLEKDDRTAARVYRKGVFVRSVDAKELPSLYDYNVGEDVRIDESRRMDSSNLHRCAIHAIMSAPCPAKYIKNILATGTDNTHYWEHFTEYFKLSPHSSVIGQAVKELWGSNVIITDNSRYHAKVRSKLGDSRNIIYFPPRMAGWYCAAKWHVDTAEKYIHVRVANAKGVRELKDRKYIDSVIDVLSESGHIDTRKKSRPEIWTFTSVMDCESQLRGFATDGGIYLCHDSANDLQTIIEELAHYYTGAGDFSRDLQDWAFNVASYFLREQMNA